MKTMLRVMLSVVALGATVQAGVFDVRDFGAKRAADIDARRVRLH